MEYLFLANIGPVQGFIASARRSRDLYFGSWLLSELAKAAAQEIANLNGTESLIFPAPKDMQSLFPDTPLNVANKIVALIHQSPEELGVKIHIAIFKRLHQIQEIAFRGTRDLNRENAEKQINDLVEYFWVAIEYNGHYAATRNEAEALMAARKNTHDFRRVEWGSRQPKSSIDGQLESIIPEDKYPDHRDKDIARKHNRVQFLYNNYKAGPAERLSGVDLLKRKGEPYPHTYFPSTTHIAAISFLDRLILLSPSNIAKARELWEKYIDEAKKLSEDKMDRVSGNQAKHPILGDIEGSLLFEERLVDLLDFIENVNSAQFREAKKALQQFYSFVDGHLGRARPDPYYAILHADGDLMGEVINKLATETQGLEQHHKLSRSLNAFAGSVRNTVEEHRGALVYAGGDDVLAFLPLHTVLECASKLAANFREMLANFHNEKGQSPTLSVGIAIVHHLHSLSDALNIARAAEKAAKNVPDKNALAIIVRKRSGGEYIVAGHWNYLDTNLEKLIGYYLRNDIPAGMAYELQYVVQLLTIPDASATAEYQILQEAAHAEVDRILKRKLEMMYKEAAEANEIVNSLLAILEMASDKSELFSAQAENFINMLLAAQIFAQANKLAKPDR